MKKIIYLIAFLTFIFSASCYKEATYSSGADVTWVTYISSAGGPGYASGSSGNYGIDGDSTNSIYTNTGDYLILRDLSQGTTSHKWVIDTAHCYFVSDYNDPESVIPGNTTTETQFYVIFTKQGYCNIQLINTYDQYVCSYNTNSVEAVYREEYDDWYFEQNFCVGVVAPVVNGYNVVRTDVTGIVDTVLVIDGTENLETIEYTDIVLCDGDYLTFTYDKTSDVTYGVTALTSWTVPNASKGSLVDGTTGQYQFNTAVSEAVDGFYVTGYRYSLGDADASTVKSIIPITVQVVETQIQIMAVNIAQTSAFNKFQFPLSKEIRNYGDTIDWTLASAFTVDVTDEVTGTTVSHAVTSIDTTSALNYMRLVIADSIDSYDKTFVINYEADKSDLKIFATTDTEQRFPNESFSVDCSPYRLLSTDYFDFDLTTHASISSNLDNPFWTGSATSEEPSTDGSYVEFVESFGGYENMLYFNVASPGSVDLSAVLSTAVQTSTYVTEGDYYFRAKIYVESKSGDGNIEFRTHATSSSNTTLATISTSDCTTGSWTTVEYPFSVVYDDDVTALTHCIKGFTVKVPAEQFPSGVKFYVDEIYIGKNLD